MFVRGAAPVLVAFVLAAGCATPDAGPPASPAGTTSTTTAPVADVRYEWRMETFEGEIRSAASLTPEQGAAMGGHLFVTPDGAEAAWFNLTFDVQGSGEIDVTYLPPGCDFTANCDLDFTTTGLALHLQLTVGYVPGEWEVLQFATTAAVGTWTLEVHAMFKQP